MSNNLSQILKLSIPERILLVEAIWDSIVKENDQKNTYQLSDDQINFLEEEIAAYGKDPEQGSTWEEIKNRIKNKR
ncbi:MAG: addiction module protein [Bacteroidetes bacterium]|nr:addiction module protein [Bacteroidota bacterium]